MKISKRMKDDFAKLRQAIYDFDKNEDKDKTADLAQKLAEIRDYCNIKYGAKATNAEVDKALAKLHQNVDNHLAELRKRKKP